MSAVNGGTILKAGGALALAGLCATGVASGIACPILMGAAGTLAFSAFTRKGAACPACEIVGGNEPDRPVSQSTSVGGR